MTKIEKYVLSIGLNDKDTKKPMEENVAISLVETSVLKYADGSTISIANGTYKHENGTTVREKSLKCELLFVDTDTVKSIVNEIKAILNQESIAVEKLFTESELW